MSDLTDFLLARIAEDEADAREMAGLKADGSWDDEWPDVDGYAVSGRMMRVGRRVLAECEAKRRIVEWMSDEVEYVVYSDDVLHALATVYADHPDYRTEWRP